LADSHRPSSGAKLIVGTIKSNVLIAFLFDAAVLRKSTDGLTGAEGLTPTPARRRDKPMSRQLYLSGLRGRPILTVSAQCIRNSDEVSCDGGDDDLARFSDLAEAFCEGPQAWVVM